MEEIKKYKLLTKHPKDEFIDLEVGVKLDSHQVTRFLNEQNKRIKDLKHENQRLHTELSQKVDYIHEIVEVKEQLKQSQKQLAIEKLEKVKECIHSYVRKRNKECAVGYYNEIPKYRFDEIIENQIKSLKGEE